MFSGLFYVLKERLDLKIALNQMSLGLCLSGNLHSLELIRERVDKVLEVSSADLKFFNFIYDS